MIRSHERTTAGRGGGEGGDGVRGRREAAARSANEGEMVVYQKERMVLVVVGWEGREERMKLGISKK
jgi:hypothetical protein